MLAAFAAIGFAISARALLFLALIGAFVLALLTTFHEGWGGLITLAIYGALIMLPLVYLELRSKR